MGMAVVLDYLLERGESERREGILTLRTSLCTVENYSFLL